MRADVAVELSWTGQGLEFDGAGPAGGVPPIRLDGDGVAGPSPMQTLLLALGGCAGADMVEILGGMRVPVKSVGVRLEGERVADPPRRYRRIRMVFSVGAPAGSRPKVERAAALSTEKYCSVLHTMRPDIEVGTEVVLL